MIVPSVPPGAGLPLGWREVLITAGFLGLFVLSRRWFFSRFQPGPGFAASASIRRSRDSDRAPTVAAGDSGGRRRAAQARRSGEASGEMIGARTQPGRRALLVTC